MTRARLAKNSAETRIQYAFVRWETKIFIAPGQKWKEGAKEKEEKKRVFGLPKNQTLFFMPPGSVFDCELPLMSALEEVSRQASADEVAGLVALKGSWFGAGKGRGGNRKRGRGANTSANGQVESDERVENAFMGCNPVTLERKHVAKGKETGADGGVLHAGMCGDRHWFTWKVDGLHCQLIQFRRRPPASSSSSSAPRGEAVPPRPAETQKAAEKGGFLEQDSDSVLPPFDERMFFVFRNGAVRVVDASVCQRLGLEPLLFASNNGVGPVALDGELAWRKVYVPPETATQYEKMRIAEAAKRETTASYAWAQEPRKSGQEGRDERALLARCRVTRHLAFVCCDCLAFGTFLGKAKLQTRLSRARECIDGRDPRERQAMCMGAVPGNKGGIANGERPVFDRCAVRVVYKPHMAPASSNAVTRDVPPCLVGMLLDGVIATPVEAAYRPGTNHLLYKCKPPRLQSIDVQCCGVDGAGAWCTDPVTGSLFCARFPSPPGGGQNENGADGILQAVLACAEKDGQIRKPCVLELLPKGASEGADRQGAGKFRWEVARLRTEKTRGNAPETVRGVLAALEEPVLYPQ